MPDISTQVMTERNAVRDKRLDIVFNYKLTRKVHIHGTSTITTRQ
jgi:hypothetical protein